MARKSNSAVAGKDAAQSAAAAPAEQQDALPAGTTQADASAPTDTTGAAASAAASTEQTTASEAPGKETGSNGQDAQPAGGATTSGPEAPAATPAKAVDGSLDDGEVEGLWIEAIPEQGFRRLGYRFTREGTGIALSALTEEQIRVLESEPNLKVERGTFSGLVE